MSEAFQSRSQAWQPRSDSAHRIPPRRPWFLAMPPIVHCRPSEDGKGTLHLHTFQTVEAYEELIQTGSLEGLPRYWDPLLGEAYPWMKRRMDSLLPTTGDGMVWLWASTTRRELLRAARRQRGAVLISVRLPRENVLLSHFMDWHHVLNKSLHIPGRRGETYAEWEARFDRHWDEWSDRTVAYRDVPLESWPDPLRDELERSWEPIIDPTTWLDSYDGKTFTTTRYVQATAHRITLDVVTRAVRIV